jgi:FkbH-like protein
LLRLEDWIRDIDAAIPQEERNARLRQNCSDLLTAIDASARCADAPLLVCFCPLSAALQRRPLERRAFEDLLDGLMGELRDKPGVHVIAPADLHRLYPVDHAEDEHGDALGHIPYSAQMYVALGTLVARKLVALRRRPYKVIVLDCDNTLWGGVCGEAGPRGIDVTPGHLSLQRFMLAQGEAGMLLCLASKNNADDVDAVFAHNANMPLRRGSFVASRIGWQPKSQSLRELAAELQLGLDSFIFVDDSPIECAEVQANCPEVLVLQLPQAPELVAPFLDQIWAFDHAAPTADARRRADQYRENRQREALRAGASSFAEFLDSLDLRVTIEPLASAQLERAAELTQRTNQFNLRPQPRQAGEIRSLGTACLGVRVIDRFGDYGLTGVIAYDARGGVLCVDTFLLSCRVLGRGVEYQAMAHLGRIAEEAGCGNIELPCVDTGKNGPVLSFLETVAGPSAERADAPRRFRIAAAEARRLRPTQAAEHRAEASPPERARGPAEPALRSTLVQCIADTLNTACLIQESISESTRRIAETRRGYQAPQTPTEQQLASIWSAVLNQDKIGVRDDFFELGGHSLLATQVVSQIRGAFGIDLPLRALFEAPTIESLAAAIDEAQLRELDRFDESELEAMLARMDGEQHPN